jgi:hypothetical protein
MVLFIYSFFFDGMSGFTIATGNREGRKGVEAVVTLLKA